MSRSIWTKTDFELFYLYMQLDLKSQGLRFDQSVDFQLSQKHRIYHSVSQVLGAQKH